MTASASVLRASAVSAFLPPDWLGHHSLPIHRRGGCGGRTRQLCGGRQAAQVGTISQSLTVLALKRCQLCSRSPMHSWTDPTVHGWQFFARLLGTVWRLVSGLHEQLARSWQSLMTWSTPGMPSHSRRHRCCHVCCRKWNVKPQPYGESWVQGDVMGCGIDLDAGSITFWRNGQCLGVAYDRVRTMQPSLAYFPAVSLSHTGGVLVLRSVFALPAAVQKPAAGEQGTCRCS